MTEEELVDFAKSNEIPDEVARWVLERPRLLAGENEDHYFELLSLVVEEFDPMTYTEYLVSRQLTDLWWDIRRYGRWKNALLATSRRAAIEDAFLKTDPARIVAGNGVVLRAKAKQDAQHWSQDPKSHPQLGLQLKQGGYDEEAINAGAFAEGQVTLSSIERFLSSARTQMNKMLREAFVRREFVVRARKALEKRLEAESDDAAETQAEAA